MGEKKGLSKFLEKAPDIRDLGIRKRLKKLREKNEFFNRENDDDNDDDNSNNNNNNNNNNNFPETRKYWVDVQWGIVSSHGERDPL